jgi:hypothetical protein
VAALDNDLERWRPALHRAVSALIVAILGLAATPIYHYEKGTWGPDEANALIAESGSWLNPKVKHHK